MIFKRISNYMLTTVPARVLSAAYVIDALLTVNSTNVPHAMNYDYGDHKIYHVPNDRDPSIDHDAQSAITTQRASHANASTLVVPMSATYRPWEDNFLEAQRTVLPSCREVRPYLRRIELFGDDLRGGISDSPIYSDFAYNDRARTLHDCDEPLSYFQSPWTPNLADTVYQPARSSDQELPRDAPVFPESGASAATESLTCHYQGCKASFHGPHRRGNQLRHLRTHPREYPCEAVACEKVFQRQDARLKHYRKEHPELNMASAIPRKSERSSTLQPEDLDTPLYIATESDNGPDETATLAKHSSWLYDLFSGTDRIGPTSLQQTTQYQANAELDSRAHANEAGGLVGATLTCPTCDLCFARPSEYRRHMRKHSRPTFRCVVLGCDKSFYRNDKLRDHVRQRHKGTLSTTKKGILQFEAGGETEKPEKPSSYTCTQCDLEFSTMGQLNSHVNRKHNQRFECEECGKAFNLRADLNRHKVSVHHPSSGSSWRCLNVACGKVFRRKDNYQRHVQSCKKSSEVPIEDDVT
jgi:uncharacterized C2H2 Zn-finger protein